MKLASLRDLLIDELKDLYSAENQLVKALPKMAKAVSSDDLRSAIEKHLKETEGHVERLDEIFTLLEVKSKTKKCKAMEGLIKEGQEMISEDGDDAVKDAGIIAAAQRVEHYEMAGYGCVRTFARHLGLDEVVELLQQTLDEEKAADEKLTEVAESEINVHAESR